MEKNYGEEEFGWSPKHSVLNSYISGTWEAFDMLFWESRTGAADSGAEEDQGYIYIYMASRTLSGWGPCFQRPTPDDAGFKAQLSEPFELLNIRALALLQLPNPKMLELTLKRLDSKPHNISVGTS